MPITRVVPDREIVFPSEIDQPDYGSCAEVDSRALQPL